MTDFSSKNILAIDCATSDMKLGLQFGGDRLVKSSTEAKQSHSSLIIEKIDSLIESAGCKVIDIDAIVVCTGPGSFTGLRIGIACAKGMAVALDIPVVGVNLFEIAAYKLSDEKSKVKVIVPFKRDEVFTAEVFNGKFEQSTIATIQKSELKNHLDNHAVAVVGTDLTKLGLDLEEVSDIRYDATELCYLGIEKLNSNELQELDKLEPLYVQKSQAEIRFERNQSQKK